MVRSFLLTPLLSAFISVGAVGMALAQEPEEISSAIYVNDMDHVLGDVKQAFIRNLITTEAQADNLIEGLKALHVDGIRIPIYPEGLNPNQAMFDYFYEQAVAEGFRIYANPAQSSGANKIACGTLTDRCTTNSIDQRTNTLIDRIKDFADEYEVDWIGPFNEDGAPGADWTAAQIDNIFSSLDGDVNGAELIGPDVWGIPASISVLNETEIEDHISVAGTHNLGFHHSSWPTFQALAILSGLPVWDTCLLYTSPSPRDRG